MNFGALAVAQGLGQGVHGAASEALNAYVGLTNMQERKRLNDILAVAHDYKSLAALESDPAYQRALDQAASRRKALRESSTPATLPSESNPTPSPGSNDQSGTMLSQAPSAMALGGTGDFAVPG